MNPKLALFGKGLLLLVALTAGLYLSGLFGSREAAVPDSQSLGGGFQLNSADGPVALQQLRGKVVLIYFGYTSCPDICPTSLGWMTAAFKLLTPEQLAQVQGVFISVDPERDNVEQLARYTAYFHPSILGLTGTPAEIAEVAGRYRVVYHKVEYAKSAMGYGIDHSSSTYLLDQQGRVNRVLPHGTSADEIRAAILKLL